MSAGLCVVAEIVQRLEGHPAGHRAVPDDCNDTTVLVAGQPEARGETGCPAQRGGGVAVLDDIMGRLGGAGVSRQTVALAEPFEALPATRDELVHVGLMAGVPDNDISRRFEDPMQRHRELDCAEIRSQVSAGARDGLHDEVPYLCAELVELRGAERSQVSRTGELGEVH